MRSVLRSQFIKFGALALAAGVPTHWARAANDKTERRLAFHSTHTAENIDVVYRIGNDYIPESLAQIDRVLRDHRNNEIYPMRIELLDLLHTLSMTDRFSRDLRLPLSRNQCRPRRAERRCRKT